MKVNEVVRVGLVSGCAVTGVRQLRLGYAELGVSGYVIENGPGVWVRCDGWMYSSFRVKFVVSSRREVGLLDFISLDSGLGVRGEAFSIAVA